VSADSVRWLKYPRVLVFDLREYRMGVMRGVEGICDVRVWYEHGRVMEVSVHGWPSVEVRRGGVEVW